MFYIYPNENQKELAKNLVENNNFGNRGKADGNVRMQTVGILGQICLADLLSLNRPEGTGKFDGGFDFIIYGTHVDVKTMGRTVDMKSHYVHNFIGYQLKYDCKHYIFLSYNYTNNKLTICGIISKDDFLRKSKFYQKGELRFRDDGSSFPSRAPLYEIQQSDLYQVQCIEDIYKYIKEN